MENIPENESVILCANHINTWDAIGIITSHKRKIEFMAKEEIFNNVLINWSAHIFDIIPVKREARDMEAMKRAIKALKNNGIVGIFPEGTRQGLEKGAKIQNGAAYLAIKSKVKVIPIGIQGDFKIFRKVKVYYGEPLDFSKYEHKNPTKEELNEATKEIMDNIIMLTNTGK